MRDPANASIIHHMRFRLSLPLILFVLFLVAPALAENPHWIWHDNQGAKIQVGETRFFRKTFTLNTVPTRADISVSADDEAEVYLNGKKVAEPKDWRKPTYENVTRHLRKGENVI